MPDTEGGVAAVVAQQAVAEVPQDGETPQEPTLGELQAQLADTRRQLADRDRALSKRVTPEEVRSLSATIGELQQYIKAFAEVSLDEGEYQEEPKPVTRLDKFRQATTKSSTAPALSLAGAELLGRLRAHAEDFGVDLSAPPAEVQEALDEGRTFWEEGHAKEAVALVVKAMKGLHEKKAGESEEARRERAKASRVLVTDRTAPSGGGSGPRFTPADLERMSLAEYSRRRPEIDEAFRQDRIK